MMDYADLGIMIYGLIITTKIIMTNLATALLPKLFDKMQEQ